MSSLVQSDQADGRTLDSVGTALVPVHSSKLNPICQDSQMMRESMNSASLQAHCYPADFSLARVADCSADCEGGRLERTSSSSLEFADKARLVELEAKSDQMTPKVTRRVVSRNGRDMQRWGADHVRLVTGVVPILANGSIVLVSSGKRTQWILPKGGWEEDECLEESAIREAYEESGCCGILGPPLEPIVYERRKVREARQAIEKENLVSTDGNATSRTESSTIPSPVSYTHVQMVLFPLYVKEVRDSWPESGRLRKAVSLDDAMSTVAHSRPELQSILQQVKEKKLHLVCSDCRSLR